ncbi:MAG: NAD-dependent epimerase/dehydratase family protein [Patescibacteria group bacterium]
MAQVPFEKKNILVTGGAGFIGSHLCERLLKDAHVICLDNFTNSSTKNIDYLLKNSDFEFLRTDINQPIVLENFSELKKFNITVQGIQEIYHLACPTSAKNFDEYRLQTLDANSVGMKHVLDLGVKYKAKVVFASSSVIYGPRGARPFREDDWGTVNLATPRSCYDEGKRFAETMCATYGAVHGLDARIARIFRTYGPRLKLYDGQMISDFITDALEGKDLVIYGDETFRTTLCYVSDIVDGLVKLMEASAGVGSVNLGSDVDVALVDVARQIVAATGSSSKIVFEPPLQFITSLGIPDLTKARESLGWIPLVRLEDGLKRSIEYAVAHRGLL